MHAVVRTDLMTGTDVCADLRSFKYMGAGTTPTDIDNGNVVKLTALAEGEREIWTAVTPAANTPIKEIVLVATPEVMYDERKKNLDEFYNEAKKACRGYVLHSKDIFSVTAEALTVPAPTSEDDDPFEIEVGNIVELAADTKLHVVASATASTTTVGKIIAIDVVGAYTYYVIEVA